MTIQDLFEKELSDLLRKYDAHLSSEDHYRGYPECGEDIRITVEFEDYNIEDIDLGQYFYPNDFNT